MRIAVFDYSCTEVHIFDLPDGIIECEDIDNHLVSLGYNHDEIYYMTDTKFSSIVVKQDGEIDHVGYMTSE